MCVCNKKKTSSCWKLLELNVLVLLKYSCYLLNLKLTVLDLILMVSV